MSEDVKHRTIRYLQDARSAQATIESANNSFINDTDDQNLKTLFQSIATQTKSQGQRVEARINALGGDVSGTKDFIGSVMAKAAEVPHGNRGLFESLIAWSNAIGDTEPATLGKQLQDENVSTAEQIFPHISRYAQTALANTNTAPTTTTTGTYVS